MAKVFARDHGLDNHLRVHGLKSLSLLPIKAEYLANDCFHLSLKGQEELARLVGKEILDVPRR